MAFRQRSEAQGGAHVSVEIGLLGIQLCSVYGSPKASEGWL